MAQFHRGREELAASHVLVFRNADVVERTVGEGPAAVAFVAAPFAIENQKASLGGCIDCILVAIDPAIEWSIGREDRAFVSCDCFLDMRTGDCAIIEGGGKAA